MEDPSEIAGPHIGGLLLTRDEAESILGQPVEPLGTSQTFDACSYMSTGAELSYAVMELGSAEDARTQYHAVAANFGPAARALEYGEASIASTQGGVSATFTVRGAWNASVIVRDYGSGLDTFTAATAALRLILDALPDLS